MFVVPLQGDKIRVMSEAETLRVKSYTSLKSEPAVYLTSVLADGTRAIYLSDIVELNGVKVEYDSDFKILKALGPIKRRYNLPQPGDTIVTKLIDTDYKQEEVTLEVTRLKLHDQHNLTRSLEVICDKTKLSLADILDIRRKVGSEQFDQVHYKKLYLDYLPYTTKL